MCKNSLKTGQAIHFNMFKGMQFLLQISSTCATIALRIGRPFHCDNTGLCSPIFTGCSTSFTGVQHVSQKGIDYAFRCIHIDPYRSISIHIDPYRSISIHIDPYRSISIHITEHDFLCTLYLFPERVWSSLKSKFEKPSALKGVQNLIETSAKSS